jgi:HlyD family secretion protein
MKKVIIAILAIALLVAGYFVYRRFTGAKQVQAADLNLETATVQKGSLVSTIDATGTVRSAQSATLNWGTSGTVDTVNAALWDKVKAGDVLATLQQTSLPQSVITAQADLQNAKVALDDLYTSAKTSATQALNDIATYAKSVRDAQYQLDNFTVPTDQQNLTSLEALDQTSARLEKARAAFDPYKFDPQESKKRQDLLTELNAAQSEYDAAVKRLQYEYNLQVAQDNLDKARQDYTKWKDGPDPGDIAASNAKIAAAEATLAEAGIAAPFDGTVTQVVAQPGDLVTAGNQAFRLDNLTNLYVDVQVSEVDVSQIKVSQPVTVTFDAIRGKQYQGEVDTVGAIGNNDSGVVNFTVTVKLTNPDVSVLPGMTSTVEIEVARQEQALLVPNQAIRNENGASVVYVLSPGSSSGMKIIPVTLGAASDTQSQVLGGELKAGDRVVLNPPASTTIQQRGGLFFGGPGRNEAGAGGSNTGGPGGNQPPSGAGSAP